MTAFEDLSDDELHHQLVAAFDEHVTEMFLVARDMARAPERLIGSSSTGRARQPGCAPAFPTGSPSRNGAAQVA